MVGLTTAPVSPRGCENPTEASPRPTEHQVAEPDAQVARPPSPRPHAHTQTRAHARTRATTGKAIANVTVSPLLLPTGHKPCPPCLGPRLSEQDVCPVTHDPSATPVNTCVTQTRHPHADSWAGAQEQSHEPLLKEQLGTREAERRLSLHEAPPLASRCSHAVLGGTRSARRGPQDPRGGLGTATAAVPSGGRVENALTAGVGGSSRPAGGELARLRYSLSSGPREQRVICTDNRGEEGTRQPATASGDRRASHPPPGRATGPGPHGAPSSPVPDADERQDAAPLPTGAGSKPPLAARGPAARLLANAALPLKCWLPTWFYLWRR